ncbi:carboxymuconolactone decarboxylase family protein [Fulvivirga lutea]|uniref:Carboxymuconolactone decarboxylase family protein n=1 Tax=Fulvivirga lutea TaxID=2810512 RepID=A0A975A0R0_9BACT|nr:carboxymuconolactone decarboxylase family protein [Fulvivirga lutea]QSE97465.1 carboxymuconolactone decarboxylase family protein [Fulvivirga lutea]
MATQINVPTKNEVSANNQAIFDQLEKGLGFVPNLYATYAHNETALADYLALQNRKSTLTAKEREVINLVVSQVNECNYCLAAHTALGKMNGFTDDQILEIRTGNVSFNEKLNALAAFVKNITENRSKPSSDAVDNLFNAGYTKANLVDIIMVIGDKIISNFIHGATQIPVDFPAAPELETINA